jgi:hypothetical protein
MNDKHEFLEFWGLTDAPDADEQWTRKVALDARNASIDGEIKPNMGIIPDIEPYQSMIDGSIIHSRSRHRTHLKDHGCVEVGNEIKAASTMPKASVVDLKPEIIKQVYLAKEALRRKH